MTKLFFAGCEGTEFSAIAEEVNGRCLVSYFHMQPEDKKTGIIKGKRPNCKELFIDSGAFSAWSLKKFINIDDYIEFCKKTDADYYAVYDAIGDPDKTLENQKYMESKGVKPIPCYHFGEDMKFLDYYCEHYDYIAIGGMVGNRGLIKTWLQMIFDKYPNKNFHGFGLTTVDLILPFPWYSVDSSSWLMGGRSGTLWSFKNGNLYFRDLKKDLSKVKLFIQEIEETGLTKDECLVSHLARNKFNAYQYFKIESIENTSYKQSGQQQLFGFEHDEYIKPPEPEEEQDELEELRKEFPGISDDSLQLILKQRGENC